jgi:drug/metabolite transporter (DMT)-like permease
MMEIKAE